MEDLKAGEVEYELAGEFLTEIKNVKITESRLSFFLFYFQFIFHFSIFRILGLGLKVISHTVISVISDSIITTLIMRLERKK